MAKKTYTITVNEFEFSLILSALNIYQDRNRSGGVKVLMSRLYKILGVK